MRPVDNIVVTIDRLLSLSIDGLPTSNRAMRRLAASKNWPVVYGENGQYLILLDAIPEPWGDLIRDALPRHDAPVAKHMPPAPLPMNPAEASTLGTDKMEGRLAIIFETFRRAIYLGTEGAITSVAQDARNGALPEHLQRAANLGLLRRGTRQAHGHYTSLSPSTIKRWLTEFKKSDVMSLQRYTVT